MGILDSVANIFRPVQAVQVQAPPQPLAQTNPGADPATLPQPGTSKATPPNPLDEMAALWKTDPKSQPTADPLSTPLFNTDPAKIAQAAGKIDFLKNVPQELMAKALAGNDPQALVQLMNTVAQQTLATATQLNAATIEQATQRNNSRITDALPGRVKQIQLDSMQPEHPVLQHPAAQPFLQLVRSQIQMKEPNLSPAEINRKAEAALTGFAGQLTAPTPAAQEADRQKTAGTDWDSWAST